MITIVAPKAVTFFVSVLSTTTLVLSTTLSLSSSSSSDSSNAAGSSLVPGAALSEAVLLELLLGASAEESLDELLEEESAGTTGSALPSPFVLVSPVEGSEVAGSVTTLPLLLLPLSPVFVFVFVSPVPPAYSFPEFTWTIFVKTPAVKVESIAIIMVYLFATSVLQFQLSTRLLIYLLLKSVVFPDC